MAESFGVLGEGTVFAGDYRVVRPLAMGGMGAVYVVSQDSTGKERALKLMRPELAASADARRRFLQEARIGARIESEHVVEIHSAGVDEASGAPYLVMELLSGEDLSARLERGPLSRAEVREIFEQVCHAMAAAHDQGIVHRDLKPENVFLATAKRAGAEKTNVKVLDFGIAKLALEAGSASTGVIGTPLWMAPEQADRGKVTPAADVWALGLMVYRALTGRYFWRSAEDPEATYTQVLKEVVIAPIPLPSERAAEQGVAAAIPHGVNQLIARTLTREPGARPRSAREFWNELSAALEADPRNDATLASVPNAAHSLAPPQQQTVPVSQKVASATAMQATHMAGAGAAVPQGTPPPVSGRARPIHHDSLMSTHGVSPKLLTGMGVVVVLFATLLYMRVKGGPGSMRPTVTVRDDALQPMQPRVFSIGEAPTSPVVLTVPGNVPAAPLVRPPPCRLCTGSVTVNGPLTKEQIVSAVEGAFPQLDEECIARHGKKVVRAGTVTIGFTVKEGDAGLRNVVSSTARDGADECLVRAFRIIRFPVATDLTEVTYTLRYSPQL